MARKKQNGKKSTAKSTKKSAAKKSGSSGSRGKAKTPKKASPVKHKGVPSGYTSITPYISVENADQAIDFYRRAFDAKEKGRLSMPDGRIAHAEIQIGNALIMLSDAAPEWNNPGPRQIGGTPVTLHLYVADVDRTFQKAIDAGATVERPVDDQFYGDRMGVLLDPYGHRWSVGTQLEQLTFRQMQTRMEKIFGAE
ncbi:MAG: VOC family protein [Leptospiraceae bacterium]|nr:VOC family protein [Leptospiraceae bacterium]MCB1316995.1 VOC family protein [Leptospiraceae bacterium]